MEPCCLIVLSFCFVPPMNAFMRNTHVFELCELKYIIVAIGKNDVVIVHRRKRAQLSK